MNKHLNITIYGLVQGIFFRASTKRVADQLGIKGFVRNEPNGSVYIEAEGEKSSLDKFLNWCKQGPSAAQVEKVEVREGKPQNFTNFQIK